MNNRLVMYQRNHLQAGLVLPMVLIFLVIMMFLGTAAIRNVTLEEKSAGNLRGRNLAFQAAEQALRYCETAVLRGAVAAVNLPILDEGPITTGANAGKNYWEVTGNWTNAAMAVVVPQSAAEQSNGVVTPADRPRCMAERIDSRILSTIETGTSNLVSGDTKQQFRITARGVGPDANTVAQLQSYLLF
jgi:type IV pilus assembly protein PilX